MKGETNSEKHIQNTWKFFNTFSIKMVNMAFRFVLSVWSSCRYEVRPLIQNQILNDYQEPYAHHDTNVLRPNYFNH